MDFRKFLNLVESTKQIDEDLGNLAKLGAGDLLGVFKQNQGNPVGPKFAGRWSGGLGQNAEQIDIGEITSWKDVRKAVGRTGEIKAVGAVFYADGNAFAVLNLEGSDTNMYASSSTVLLAFDPAKLPEYTPPAAPEGMSDWAKRDFERTQELPKTTNYSSTSRWDDTAKPRKFIGQQVQLRDLTRYIDDIVTKFPDHKFTCTVLTIDRKGQEKSQQRNLNRNTRQDTLADRESEFTDNYADKHTSLNKALDKYKASKNFNSFSTSEELLEFVSDVNNFGEKFVYHDKQYTFGTDQFGGQFHQEVKVTKEALIKGKSFKFDFTCRATEPSSYNSITLTYEYKNGRSTPIAVN